MEHKTVEELEKAILDAKATVNIALEKLALEFPIAKDIRISEEMRAAFEPKRANRLYKVTIEC